MPAGRDHFDDEKAFSRLGLGQDVAHEALVGALPAHFARHVLGIDPARFLSRPARSGPDRKFHRSFGGDAIGLSGRCIDGARSDILEHALAAPDAVKMHAADIDRGGAGQNDETGFAVGRSTLVNLPGIEPHRLESNMAPARRFRRHFEYAPIGAGCVGTDAKAHAASSSPDRTA